MIDDYKQIKSKYMPICGVANCGVVQELITKQKETDDLIKEINELRYRLKEEEMKKRQVDKGNEPGKKEPLPEFSEMHGSIIFLRSQLEAKDNEIGKLKAIIQGNEQQLESQRQKTALIMSYAEADDVIKEKQKRIAELTVLCDRLEARHTILERQNTALGDMLKDLEREHSRRLENIDEIERYRRDLLNYGLGYLKIEPKKPEIIEPLQVKDRRPEQNPIMRRLNAMLRR